MEGPGVINMLHVELSAYYLCGAELVAHNHGISPSPCGLWQINDVDSIERLDFKTIRHVDFCVAPLSRCEPSSGLLSPSPNLLSTRRWSNR